MIWRCLGDGYGFSGFQGLPGGSGTAQRQPERFREAQGGPGRPQEQLRNEPCEFQENLVFRPWEAFGGLRGTQNRSNRLAGANETNYSSLALGPPLAPRFFSLVPAKLGVGSDMFKSAVSVGPQII